MFAALTLRQDDDSGVAIVDLLKYPVAAGPLASSQREIQDVDIVRGNPTQ